MRNIKKIFIFFFSFLFFGISGAFAQTTTGYCSATCSDWGSCFNGLQYRSCTAKTTLQDLCTPPATSRACGICSSAKYECIAGSPINKKQNSTSWTWECTGVEAGSIASCSKSFPMCTYDCTGWSDCSNNIQTRTCNMTDNNQCIPAGASNTTKVCGADIACDPDKTSRKWNRVLIPVNEWKSGVYGNGKFLIYGGEKIITSVDGKVWASQNTGCEIRSMVFAEGHFIGSCGRQVNYVLKDFLMISIDGANWQYKQVDGLRLVAYGDGLYVSVGGTSILTSKDGYNWTPHKNPYPTAYINDITFGNGIFIMSGGGRVMTSSDGVNWKAHSVGNSNLDWDQITYGKGLFFGVNRHATVSMVSSDGINWKDTGFDIFGSSYVNGEFLAGVQGSDNILSSSDGSDWVGENAFSGGVYFGFTRFLYGNGIYVGVGIYNANTISHVDQNTVIAVSENVAEDCGDPQAKCAIKKGVWKNTSNTLKSYIPRHEYYSRMAYGNGSAVVITNCDSNYCVMTSKDNGLSWYYQKIPHDIVLTTNQSGVFPYELEYWDSVVFANGKFYAFGFHIQAKNKNDIIVYPSVATSSDGTGWTNQKVKYNGLSFLNFYSIVYGNNIFVASGVNKQGENVAMVSSDGVNWNVQSTAIGRDLYYGNGIFISYVSNKTGSGGYDIMTSTDGVSWKIVQANFPYMFEDLVYGSGKFVGISQNISSKIITSVDGINWRVENGLSNSPGAIAYGNGIFVVVDYAYTGGGKGPSIISSTNGIDWVAENKSGVYLRDVGYVGGGSFVALPGDMSYSFLVRREIFSANETKCGISNGKGFSAFPEAGLCTNGGVATGKSETNSGWAWKCCDSDCSATKVSGVVCGKINNTFVAENSLVYTSPNLCDGGSVVDFQLNGDKYSWKCSDGVNNSSLCFATVAKNKISGLCGASHGKSFLTEPKIELCESGSFVFVTEGAFTWEWNCIGALGGSTAKCSAIKSDAVKALCSGTSVTDAVCGDSNGKTFGIAPTVNLCKVGAATAVLVNSNGWQWNCVSTSGGATAKCSASKTVVVQISNTCGSVNKTTVSSLTDKSSNLCTTGSVINFQIYNDSYYWKCSDGVSSSDWCLASIPKKEDGLCGSSNAKSFENEPKIGLCKSGTATTVNESNNKWQWNCVSTSGGATAKCSATKVLVVQATCGSVNKTTVSSLTDKSSNLCTTGSVINFQIYNGKYYWRCIDSSRIAGSVSSWCNAIVK